MHDIPSDDAGAVDRSSGPPGALVISLELVRGEAVVRVAGEVDASTATELHEAACKLCEQRHRQVVFDLSRVGFIDAAGLRVIGDTARRLAEQSGRLRLRSPSRFTARLLDVVGLAELVESEGSNE